jgi:predicted transcriptional regulator
MAKGVVFLGLRSALNRLAGDRATANVVREVLQLLRTRTDEPFSAAEIARRLGRPESAVAVILLEFADAFVVRRDGQCYVYVSNPVLDADVDRFTRRAESQSAFVQTNVAKFRDRYGYR